MAGSSTIKEFLVSLGVDVKGAKDFFVTIDNMTVTVVKFVAALETIGATLKAALVATASALENLFYIAQRAGTTVDTLKELQYGMRQIGLSAEDANSALESLAMSMRLNPGNESLLHHLGVATREASGAMRDTTAITGDFIARLSKMPFFIAAQYAEMFGINARTLFQLLQNFGQLQAREREWRDAARATGVDLQDSAAKSRDFMNSLRSVIEVLDLLWIKVSTVLIERLRPQLDEFRRFLLAHAKDIEDFGIDVGNAIIDASEAVIKLLPEIDKLVKSTIGWKDALNVIGDIIIYRIFGPLGLTVALLAQVAKYLEKRGVKPDDLKPQMPHPGDFTTVLKELGKLLFGWMDDLRPSNPVPREWLHKQSFEQLTTSHGDVVPASFATEDGEVPYGNLPINVRQNNPGNLRSSASAIGSGGGFAIFRSAFDGLVAMRDNLLAYSKRGLDTIRGIVNRWAPPSENNTRSYIAMMARMLGVSPDAHLNMSDPNTLSGLMKGITRIEGGYNPYGSDLYDRAARFGMGGASAANNQHVTIQQKTDIHVQGHEPHSTAREVERKQDMVNAALVRNMRSAVIA